MTVEFPNIQYSFIVFLQLPYKQGIPIDSHLLLIFHSLGWVPPEESSTKCTMLARATMEGWFPKEQWGQLNQQYAGLGQLLRDKGTAINFLKHAWNKSEDPNHPFTIEDYLRLEAIAKNCYNVSADVC